MPEFKHHRNLHLKQHRAQFSTHRDITEWMLIYYVKEALSKLFFSLLNTKGNNSIIHFVGTGSGLAE